MYLLLFPLPGAFFFKEGISESLWLTRSPWIFAESCIPYKILSPCTLHLPAPGGKAPAPHKAPRFLLLPPSFFGCSAPESHSESPTPPCSPHRPPALPKPAPNVPRSSAGPWSQPAQLVMGNTLQPTWPSSSSVAKHRHLVKGKLSYRPLCMPKSEQIVPNTHTLVHKQVSEEGRRFKVSLNNTRQRQSCSEDFLCQIWPLYLITGVRKQEH